jgi:hypothetical protein
MSSGSDDTPNDIEVPDMRPMLVCIIALAINVPVSTLAQSIEEFPNDNQHYG